MPGTLYVRQAIHSFRGSIAIFGSRGPSVYYEYQTRADSARGDVESWVLYAWKAMMCYNCMVAKARWADLSVQVVHRRDPFPPLNRYLSLQDVLF